jgi:hypothetical protein
MCYRAMQTMGLSFEDVSTDAVDRVLKILSAGGYTLKGGRTAQEADTRLQILASMVAMHEEDKLQAWNAGNNIKQIMDQGDGRVVIIVQLREVVKCSKADIVTNLRPILPEISVGDVTDLVQVPPKNQTVSGGKGSTIDAPGFEVKIPSTASRTYELGEVIQTGEIQITMPGIRSVQATLKVRLTLMQEVIIDVQERKKIKTMLDVLTVVGDTLEDLNKVMSVGFRISLKERNLDEGFMGARMVEQVFRNGAPVRLGPEDIVRSTDYAGPSFRLYWSSATARDKATQ